MDVPVGKRRRTNCRLLILRITSQHVRYRRDHGNGDFQHHAPYGLSDCHYFNTSFPGLLDENRGTGAGSEFRAHVEAGTELRPLPRLYDTVAVQVGTEITMTAHTHVAVELPEQLVHQQTEHTALFGRTGIFRITGGVQTAFITDADAVGIQPLDVRTGKGERASLDHRSVAQDVVVVTDAAEAATEMVGTKGVDRIRTVFAGGAAMQHDVVYLSHDYQISD